MKTMTKVALLTSALVGLSLTSTQANAKTYTQRGYGLTPYRSVKSVNNANHFVSHSGAYTSSPNYYALNTFQNQPTVYKSNGGNKSATFKTAFFLPVSYQRSGQFGNPQSIAMSKNGDEAYIMYTLTGGSNTGFVVHYDLNKLRSTLGASSNSMDVIRRASNAFAKNKLTPQYKSVLAAIKVGPTFNTGHGQSMALNPKTNQLWFVQTPGTSGGYATVQRLSKTSLKPDTTLKFRLRSGRNNVTMGENLTFDAKGKAYFSSLVAGSKAMRIYQGSINTKQTKFKLVQQLKYRPGTINQSVGYSSKSNRLFLISDDAITSVPVSKLGRLKAKDVHATTFASGREFEAVVFNNDGTGYLLTNKGPELLQTNSLN